MIEVPPTELGMGGYGGYVPPPDGLVPFASEIWGVQEKLAITGLQEKLMIARQKANFSNLH